MTLHSYARRSTQAANVASVEVCGCTNPGWQVRGDSRSIQRGRSAHPLAPGTWATAVVTLIREKSKVLET